MALSARTKRLRLKLAEAKRNEKLAERALRLAERRVKTASRRVDDALIKWGNSWNKDWGLI